MTDDIIDVKKFSTTINNIKDAYLNIDLKLEERNLRWLDILA